MHPRMKTLSCLIAACGMAVPVVGHADLLYSWGDNGSGQLGDGSADNTRFTPMVIPGLTGTTTDISAGQLHNLAIHNGAVYAWGRNTSGQIGIGTTTQTNSPTPVTGLSSGATAVSAGNNHSLAIVNGAIYGWGVNSNGQVGTGVMTSRVSTPTAIPVLTSGVTAVVSGSNHNLAIQGGALYAWGVGTNGSLGMGNTDTKITPTAVPSMGSGVTSVFAGSSMSYAVKNGQVYAWGSNTYGQLGIGNTTTQNSPQLVAGLPGTVTSISAGTSHAIALVNGNIYSWGRNNNGQLGNGTVSDVSVTTPQLVLDLAVDFVSVTAGANANYAVASDGSLWVWGSNATGQLGLGEGAATTGVPTQILAPDGYQYSNVLSGGSNFVIASLTAVVPEPGTAILLTMALPLLSRRSRR